MKIEIGQGLESIRFGMSEREIMDALGEPNRINYEELDGFAVHYYNGLFVKLKFYNANSQYTLKTIETFNKETELFGQRVIGLPKHEIITLLNENGIPSDTFELHDYDDVDTIFVDLFYMTFEFMFDRLVSVQFSGDLPKLGRVPAN